MRLFLRAFFPLSPPIENSVVISFLDAPSIVVAAAPKEHEMTRNKIKNFMNVCVL